MNKVPTIGSKKLSKIERRWHDIKFWIARKDSKNIFEKKRQGGKGTYKIVTRVNMNQNILDQEQNKLTKIHRNEDQTYIYLR